MCTKYLNFLKMAEDDAYDEYSDFQDHNERKACNWCQRCVPLVNAKPYCKKCHNAAYKECVRCHRPLPDEKYFTEDEQQRRCNSCQRKYLLERNRRLAKKDKTSSKAVCEKAGPSGDGKKRKVESSSVKKATLPAEEGSNGSDDDGEQELPSMKHKSNVKKRKRRKLTYKAYIPLKIKLVRDISCDSSSSPSSGEDD